MGKVELQGTIVQDLEYVDEDMLLIFRAMLDTYLEVRTKKKDRYPEDFDLQGNPLDRDEVIAEMEEINDRVDAGKEQTTPLKDVQNRIEQWLKNSK